MNNMRIGKDGNNERTETKVGETYGPIWKDKLLHVKCEKMVSVRLQAV